jgi:hypothetical protein
LIIIGEKEWQFLLVNSTLVCEVWNTVPCFVNYYSY